MAELLEFRILAQFHLRFKNTSPHVRGAVIVVRLLTMINLTEGERDDTRALHYRNTVLYFDPRYIFQGGNGSLKRCTLASLRFTRNDGQKNPPLSVLLFAASL